MFDLNLLELLNSKTQKAKSQTKNGNEKENGKGKKLNTTTLFANKSLKTMT